MCDCCKWKKNNFRNWTSVYYFIVRSSYLSHVGNRKNHFVIVCWYILRRYGSILCINVIGETYRSFFNYCDVIGILFYRIRLNNAVEVIQGHWFGSQSKTYTVCDFLLVIDNNLHPISYRFEVITDYCWKFEGKISLPISVNWTWFLTIIIWHVINNKSITQCSILKHASKRACIRAM